MVVWLRRVGKHLNTFVVAFLLALVVWFAAILETDPAQTLDFPRPVELEIVGQNAKLVMTVKPPASMRLTLRAPRSIWTRLQENQTLVRAWVDLSGVGAGEHTLPVHVQIGLTPVQIAQQDPQEVQIRLTPLLSRTFPIAVAVSGDPPVGYQKGDLVLIPNLVTVSGPQPEVEKVQQVAASLDISGATEPVRRTLSLDALDAAGLPVSGIDLNPSSAAAVQWVSLLGGYRNVVVKVVTSGQVASGYWLTNISVAPPNVTVYSSNPDLVDKLPGYVETKPVDMTGLNADAEVRATLDLPVGVTMAGEESVLVHLYISALEGSLPISLPVEVIGLSPEYKASVSPVNVDLLISGPLPILNNLKPGGIRVSVDLTGLGPGTYQLAPVVDLLPGQLQVASVQPAKVTVTIRLAPVTPGPTATP